MIVTGFFVPGTSFANATSIINIAVEMYLRQVGVPKKLNVSVRELSVRRPMMIRSRVCTADSFGKTFTLIQKG